MDGNTGARLARCFQAVFPKLQGSATESASTETIEQWDSIHHVTLINVIEEEFGINIDPEHVEELTNYPAFLRYLEEHQ
jgi:acyl carrier protein